MQIAARRQPFGEVESTKSVSEIYAPVSGEVTAVNEAVSAAPESINADAFSAWLFKLKPSDANAVNGLMDAAAYQAYIAEKQKETSA